jgi:hypothetical protein
VCVCVRVCVCDIRAGCIVNKTWSKFTITISKGMGRSFMTRP